MTPEKWTPGRVAIHMAGALPTFRAEQRRRSPTVRLWWVWLNLTAILLVSVAVISLAVHLLRRGALL